MATHVFAAFFADGFTYWKRPASIALITSTDSSARPNSRNLPRRRTGPKRLPVSVASKSFAGVRRMYGISASARVISTPTMRSFRKARMRLEVGYLRHQAPYLQMYTQITQTGNR